LGWDVFLEMDYGGFASSARFPYELQRGPEPHFTLSLNVLSGGECLAMKLIAER
jgi:hypothetical protein